MAALLNFAGHTRLVAQLYAANYALCVALYAHFVQTSLWDALWWVTTVWFTTGNGLFLHHATAGRLVVMYTLVSSHVLILLFTANFIAKLTRHKRHIERHGETSKITSE